MASAGRELVRMFKTAVLVKGGHLHEAAAVDLLFERRKMHEFRARRVPGVSTHGTGCSYSAAIAANVGKGCRWSQRLATPKGLSPQRSRTFSAGKTVGGRPMRCTISTRVPSAPADRASFPATRPPRRFERGTPG
jgi:hydroxymethylpyrimidine/phosphomethylpyrimidine kinase